MICERCKQRPATVHFTKILNGEKYEQHLCEECSKEVPHFAFAGDPGFSLNQFLANILSCEHNLSGKDMSSQTERCENCGLTYAQFAQGGKLGCSQCYQVFRDKLDPLLRRIHSSELHKGKVPERTGGRLKVEKAIEKLKKELTHLVDREEYEKAAEIRDQIKEMEKGLPVKGE